jgi:hypothetical protein
MSIGSTLRLLLDGANCLLEGKHRVSLPMIELEEELANSDLADANATLVSHLIESTRTYWRCFARGDDGEPAETTPQELASEIKMIVLRLMNAHLELKKSMPTRHPSTRRVFGGLM